MEQQVAEAALAMVRSSTDRSTRSAASNFLEQWTRTQEAWGVYAKWLQLFNNNDASNPDTLGMQLLCLTLLLAKIRRELVKGETHEQLPPIRDALWSLLVSSPSPPLTGPLSSCFAAIVARCDQISDLIASFPHSLPPIILLKLLASLPAEVEACGELTTPQVTAELWPHMERVLDTVRRGLSSAETAGPALETLRNWAQTCHVTLSHLNSPTCGGTETLLPLLIQILSQPTAQEELLILASRALTEAIIIPTDSCTPSREDAVSKLIAAIPLGFISAPFQQYTANRQDDGAHALATLVCTLVSEEVDDLCSRPADSYLGLLLQIQAHPHTPVALTVLECWLTVQDIPTVQRHEHWKVPLFTKITEGLIMRLAYTKSFLNWTEELELDEQEFFEFRRMVNDVLVNCYFLLRIQYIRRLVTVAMTAHSDWPLTESALFCLGAVFREVCARIKARGSSTSLSADRDETAQQLLQLVQQLCAGPSPKAAAAATAKQHPVVLVAACNFIGLYAPAWNVHCNHEAIVQLISYLQGAMTFSETVEAASRASKSLYIQCANQLLNSPIIISCMRESMEVALSADHSEAMASVAEGCTRLISHMKDPSQVQQAFQNLLMPVMQRVDIAVVASSNGDTAERQVAVDALTKYLHVLQAIIRFCDNQSGTSPIGEILNSIWPFLEKAHQFVSDESVLDEVLAIHRQLLSNAPDKVAPHFAETVKFVVEVYENTKHPTILDYLASAVECFSSVSGDSEESFNQLLAHVTRVTLTYVTKEKSPDGCPQLIRAFFEMCQRYVVFSPSAILNCREFPNIVFLAVECLTVCKGERESTRATLIFLAQLFGWRSLRLAPAVSDALQKNSSIVDNQLLIHGEVVVRTCVEGLGGSMPQMLWPALSDCVFSIVSNVVDNAGVNVLEDITVAHQWVYASMASCSTTSGTPLVAETCQQIVCILFNLARCGNKSKPKAKMLLSDFALLCKGEMSVDALLSYSLDANGVQS